MQVNKKLAKFFRHFITRNQKEEDKNKAKLCDSSP